MSAMSDLLREVAEIRREQARFIRSTLTTKKEQAEFMAKLPNIGLTDVLILLEWQREIAKARGE